MTATPESAEAPDYLSARDQLLLVRGDREQWRTRYADSTPVSSETPT